MSFSILTLNLWNVSEPLEPRYRALEAGLKVLRPDIICLQEVARDPKTERSQAELVAAMSGLRYSAEGNGLAILCSGPIVRSQCVDLPEFAGDYPRQILLTDVLIEDRALLVANTHLAYRPEMARERRIQVDVLLAALKDYAASSSATAKVLCGDFNDTADAPAIRAVLDSAERFHDVYAERHPDTPGFTFFTRNKYVDPVWTVDQRIDYVFTNSDISLADCSVVFDGKNGLDLVSDHFGVFCRLAFCPSSRHRLSD
jgi:endonuclease/exonuclease/phosphatase family metal-dependent hydrolase